MDSFVTDKVTKKFKKEWNNFMHKRNLLDVFMLSTISLFMLKFMAKDNLFDLFVEKKRKIICVCNNFVDLYLRFSINNKKKISKNE